jgi:hypothetical protein
LFDIRNFKYLWIAFYQRGEFLAPREKQRREGNPAENGIKLQGAFLLVLFFGIKEKNNKAISNLLIPR